MADECLLLFFVGHAADEFQLVVSKSEAMHRCDQPFGTACHDSSPERLSWTTPKSVSTQAPTWRVVRGSVAPSHVFGFSCCAALRVRGRHADSCGGLDRRLGAGLYLAIGVLGALYAPAIW